MRRTPSPAVSIPYAADLAALRIGSFIDFWNQHRPFPLQGDGEVIVSFPGTGIALRRSDLLALIAALPADGGPVVIDPPGTCHLVGCPNKGTVDKHRRPLIGAPDDFTDYSRGTCLGFPKPLGRANDGTIHTVCSAGGPWTSEPVATLSSRDLAQLVDKHRADCIGPRPVPSHPAGES